MYLMSFLSTLLQMFVYVIFAHAIMSFLFAFGVINTSNPIAQKVWSVLSSILEPFYKPIRRYLPQTGAMDFTPLVLLLIISLMRTFLPI